MEEILNNKKIVFRFFGIKIYEINEIKTLNGITKPKKDIITEKDYKILAEYRKKHGLKNYEKTNDEH